MRLFYEKEAASHGVGQPPLWEAVPTTKKPLNTTVIVSFIAQVYLSPRFVASKTRASRRWASCASFRTRWWCCSSSISLFQLRAFGGSEIKPRGKPPDTD